MTYVEENFSSFSVQLADLDMLHDIVSPVDVLTNPIDSQRLDQANSARRDFDQTRPVLETTINRLCLPVGPVDAAGSIVKIKRRYPFHGVRLAHHFHRATFRVENEYGVSVGGEYFRVVSISRLAEFLSDARVARRTRAIVTTRHIGAQLTARVVVLTLVDVLALFIVAVVSSLVAVRTQAYRPYGRRATRM